MRSFAGGSGICHFGGATSQAVAEYNVSYTTSRSTGITEFNQWHTIWSPAYDGTELIPDSPTHPAAWPACKCDSGSTDADSGHTTPVVDDPIDATADTAKYLDRRYDNPAGECACGFNANDSAGSITNHATGDDAGDDAFGERRSGSCLHITGVSELDICGRAKRCSRHAIVQRVCTH
jgi:hypothetical protein